MVFAGAKEWETIREYQAQGIDRFVDSIDWGWFFFLTKPMFWLLHHLHELIGNMGWAIIALTLVIKALVLPLAWKSYASMAKMKELSPRWRSCARRSATTEWRSSRA
jgi:YidC/Oxa1 family membrane protein insertase